MLLDLLFPKFCLGCNKPGIYICLGCEKKLAYLSHDICIYCRKPSLYGLTHPDCKRKDCIDGVMSIFHYNNFFKHILKTIKYRGATHVFDELVTAIRPERFYKLLAIKRLFPDACLQPLPLHPARKRERGFNQALLIAGCLTKFLKTPIIDVLKRTKQTYPQAQLKSPEKRYENMRGAFGINKQIDLDTVILVDDVVTSGSTLKEAGRTLYQSGVKHVYCLTLAHG